MTCTTNETTHNGLTQYDNRSSTLPLQCTSREHTNTQTQTVQTAPCYFVLRASTSLFFLSNSGLSDLCTFKIGYTRVLLVCPTNNRRQTDHISGSHAKFGENRPKNCRRNRLTTDLFTDTRSHRWTKVVR